MVNHWLTKHLMVKADYDGGLWCLRLKLLRNSKRVKASKSDPSLGLRKETERAGNFSPCQYSDPKKVEKQRIWTSCVCWWKRYRGIKKTMEKVNSGLPEGTAACRAVALNHQRILAGTPELTMFLRRLMVDHASPCFSCCAQEKTWLLIYKLCVVRLSEGGFWSQGKSSWRCQELRRFELHEQWMFHGPWMRLLLWDHWFKYDFSERMFPERAAVKKSFIEFRTQVDPSACQQQANLSVTPKFLNLPVKALAMRSWSSCLPAKPTTWGHALLGYQSSIDSCTTPSAEWIGPRMHNLRKKAPHGCFLK